MNPLDAKQFKQIGDVSNAVSARTRPLLDRLFGRLVPEQGETDVDWSGDADRAVLMQEPLRARALLRGALVVLVLLIVWAGFAEIDEVTRGEGKVIPSSQLQVLQSFDGGVVEEILVKEGDVVDVGQTLVRIDPTRFVSSLRENRAQYFALVAKAARLEALSAGTPFVAPAEVAKAAPDLIGQERALYESSQAKLDGELAIARQQMAQRSQELVEVQARLAQASQTYNLVSQELSVTKPLLASGAVSEVELLRLERDVARLRGERNQATAQIARIQSAIAEANRNIQDVELAFRNAARNELADTRAKLNSLSEGSLALVDRVKHAEVKSPMRGTVKRLLVNTVGGVVQPGKEVAEVVPLDEALLLEAKINPKDIAFLRPGQPAEVKFTAYDFSIYGGLKATVEQIGADTVVDDRGNAFYIVRVRTTESSLGENLPIIPGMVAQVDVLTGKKTILSYLLKPVLRAKANALTER
ncbi:HlyD family type I secretion periplasmic adaptor subunit [Denitromonas iodatirespirans]|uniref:Membrane fusion protein (MFP) family protein n=1 Tax=Denitromonas iodatirespirans TaxID=2795389 RepID=A0A944HDZ1_DENI1|nr:HlyD family type I secretion periplasmic adaptor subunit [Denitromonas iodatirespirans]MBT0962441.1 HlyD family type I secretion periplasmic adaptor subunit [Denitromonas iodatirespirans]